MCGNVFIKTHCAQTQELIYVCVPVGTLPHPGVPHCLKVHTVPLCFYKRPTLVPVFTEEEKSEEDFGFYEKSSDHTNGVLS